MKEPLIAERTLAQREKSSFLLKQADALVRRGNYLEALDSIRQAKLVDPKNPYADAYEDRVLNLLEGREVDQIVADESKVEQLQLHLYRAALLLSQQKLEAALDEISRAYSISPENPEIGKLRDRVLETLEESNARKVRYKNHEAA